jgi:hypothetical protein
MPGPQPERTSTIDALPAAGEKILSCRTVPVPRRSRKIRNPSTRLPRFHHHALLRRSRSSLPKHTRSRSPRRRLQQ